MNINKPSKLENTRKAPKPKTKPKVTLTATAASSRTTRATITYAAPLKKRAKDAKTNAISPTASVEAANIKPKPKRKPRTEVDCNISRILPPRPGPDFA